MDGEAQAKALRLRMYVSGSECAYLIDLPEGNRPQRQQAAARYRRNSLVRHAAEEHAAWLEVLGVTETPDAR